MDCSTSAFLSFTISQRLLKLMSIEAVMPSNHLVLCLPFLLLPSIFPSIRVFSKESALCIPFLPSLKSAFHAEAGCFPPKHIYYCLNFLSLVAWLGLLWVCQWAAGAVKRRKRQSCHSVGQLTEATKWMSSIASLSRVCSFSENEEATVLHKPPPPPKFPRSQALWIHLYLSLKSFPVLLSHFLFSLYSKPLYSTSLPECESHLVMCYSASDY